MQQGRERAWRAAARRMVVASAVAAAMTGAVAAQELTPGGLAWRVHTNPAAAIGTLSAALSNEDPAVRTVAGRLVAAARESLLTSDVASALARETDGWAAAEQVRALLTIASPQALDAITAYLPRMEPEAAFVYLSWMARQFPARFRTELPQLLERFRPIEICPAVSVALHLHPAEREAILAIWARLAPAEDWRAVISKLRVAPDDPVETAAIVSALNSGRDGIREATVWQVLAWRGEGRPLADAILQTASELPPAIDGEVNWERVGRELLARQVRGSITPDRSAALRQHARAHQVDFAALRSVARLPGPERSVVRELAGSADDNPSRPRDPGVPMSRMQVFSPPAPRFLSSLLEAGNCRPGFEMNIGAIETTYGPDNRRARSGAAVVDLPDRCLEVLRAAANVVILDYGEVASNEAQILIVPTQQEWVRCADLLRSGRSSSSDDVDQSAAVDDPRKTRHVAPVYPSGARNAGKRGTVVVEAVIEETGCIASAAVVTSVDVPFDLAALKSVIQWKYTPARLNGKPVRAVMTVTVDFR